jgi:hypothetical protein
MKLWKRQNASTFCGFCERATGRLAGLKAQKRFILSCAERMPPP